MGAVVEYRLLERWETEQRWRKEARDLNVDGRVFEDALSEMLDHIDRRRNELAVTLRLLPVDDR